MKPEGSTLRGLPADRIFRTPTAPMDWKQIHQRLEASQAALRQRLIPDAEEKQRILKSRARLLARKPGEDGLPAASIEVVEFQVSYERYGIETEYIREIQPLGDLTPLPCTPSFVIGLITIRGQIYSVVDIKKFFDLPDKGLTDLNKVLIVSTDQMELGILADVVLGVRSIAASDFQPSFPTFTGVRGEYLKGITKDPLVILDAGKILSDKKIIVDEGVRKLT